MAGRVARGCGGGGGCRGGGSSTNPRGRGGRPQPRRVGPQRPAPRTATVAHGGGAARTSVAGRAGAGVTRRGDGGPRRLHGPSGGGRGRTCRARHCHSGPKGWWRWGGEGLSPIDGWVAFWMDTHVVIGWRTGWGGRLHGNIYCSQATGNREPHPLCRAFLPTIRMNASLLSAWKKAAPPSWLFSPMSCGAGAPPGFDVFPSHTPS